MPYAVEAKIVTFWALGWEASKILAYLSATATPVSRPTLFRILRRVDDPVLKILHVDNRRSAKRAIARDPEARDKINFWTSAWETSYSGPLASVVDGPADVYSRTSSITHVVMRWTVVLLSLRRTIFRINTLGWINRYLWDVGNAGVIVYRSRSELERAFPPDSPLRQDEVTTEAVLDESELHAPFESQRSVVRRAVVQAVRLVDAPLADAHMTDYWTSSRGFLRLGDVEDEDLYDPVRRPLHQPTHRAPRIAGSDA